MKRNQKLKKQLLVVAATALLSSSGLVVGGTFVAEAAGPAVNEKDVAAPAGSRIDAPSQETPAGLRLGIGDRLRISFFDHLDLGPPAGEDRTPINPAMRTFYQRVDLTTEARIEADGSVTVPRLGRFQATGRDAEDLQADLARSFSREMGHGGDVHIAILERPPIYVLGFVRNPGSYPFVPGMVAVHALALAGGIDRVRETAPQLRDARRERERQSQAEERLKRLLARQARLMAQQAKTPQITPAEALLALGPRPEIDRLIAQEERLAASAAEAEAAEKNMQEAAVTSAEGEVAALRASALKVTRQLELRSERAVALQNLSGRGLGNSETLSGAQRDVADFEVQKQQLQASIYQAEQRVAQAQLALKRLDVEREAALEREIMAVEDEIAALEKTAAAAAELATGLEREAGGKGIRDGAAARLEIVRRTGTKTGIIPADEVTDLLPGDVVKVLSDTESSVAHAEAETEGSRQP